MAYLNEEERLINRTNLEKQDEWQLLKGFGHESGKTAGVPKAVAMLGFQSVTLCNA